jgi:hypothetical protein
MTEQQTTSTVLQVHSSRIGVTSKIPTENKEKDDGQGDT